MNIKILVSYYTKGGATKQYAKIISETLKENGLENNISNLADNIPDISTYDTIILGTGVRMFKVYRRWKKVLNQKNLKDKTLFLFLSSGTAAEEPEKAVSTLQQALTLSQQRGYTDFYKEAETLLAKM